MKKLDSFILKSFLGPFIMTVLIVIFVLMLQFLWLYIDELVGKGLGFGESFDIIEAETKAKKGDSFTFGNGLMSGDVIDVLDNGIVTVFV